MPALLSRAPAFWQLMRFHKPIGTLLLLWPTLTALWFAGAGRPHWQLVAIFTLGVILMRAAGCVINDYADRHIDGHVERTRERPLAAGLIRPREALVLFAVLCLLALVLVLLTNRATVLLAIGAVAIAAAYPFMKRHTHLPQVVLGAAWAWSIPMAFTAQTETLPVQIWVFYAGVLLWTVAFDTFYAMVDRVDDVHIGVKSTAILFGRQDLAIIALLQALALAGFALTGHYFARGPIYFVALVGIGALFAHQQIIARHRGRAACMRAFLNNQWVGALLFGGVALDYQFGA